MQFEPDPVAGAMEKALAVPRVGDHSAGGPVDLLGGHTGRYRVEGGLLRVVDHAEHVLETGRRLPHDDGTGRVREVPAQLAPEV